MEQPARLRGQRPSATGGWRFWMAAAFVVLIAYTVTLAVANDLTVGAALAAGAANTVPVVLLGALARRLVADRLVGRPMAAQLIGHVLIGGVFAVAAYWLVTIMLGLVHGESPTAFIVRPFASRARAWQLLENVTIYGIVAALAYRQTQLDPVTVILSGGGAGEGGQKQELSRYFIRSGDDIRPIDVDRIISITGADDYAEVATLEGRHLVRLTLAEFEKALDPARFIRVHRSRIVNIDHVERAEPAGGGRLLLHMADGEVLAASRAGSRLFRERVL
jgi:two-component system LytT family response regulator